MTNIEILVKCDVSDPNFALALRSAEADELEEALLLTENQKKLGRIRAALRRSGSRSTRPNKDPYRKKANGEPENHISLTSSEIEIKEYNKYGIAPIALFAAYAVTATVIGDGLTTDQKKVEWSVSGLKDPSSEWAADGAEKHKEDGSP